MDSPPTTDKIVTTRHTFRLATEYQYLSYTPKNTPLLVLALHGYGMNAHTMLELTKPLFAESATIVSIQAPNQFYLRENLTSSEVGYNWGTRAHGNASIAFHHEMVRWVGAEMRERCGIPPARTILVGFSQPVGYNYRYSSAFPQEIAGVIGICGGVPKDWETGHYGRVSAAILHIAREQDEYFPAAVTEDYARKLRTRASDVEFHQLPGGHRFPSKGRAVVRPWIERVFGITSAADARP